MVLGQAPAVVRPNRGKTSWPGTAVLAYPAPGQSISTRRRERLKRLAAKAER